MLVRGGHDDGGRTVVVGGLAVLVPLRAQPTWTLHMMELVNGIVAELNKQRAPSE
ncbi:hypothetical protein [Streptomyces sp. S1]|uniref:hypothetical protein n=1 Tax=Streptomyces sp. S1 TaxID=718288 RepID=UPI003D725C74